MGHVVLTVVVLDTQEGHLIFMYSLEKWMA
jgi:hypothetical protein